MKRSKSTDKLSVVIPVYNSEDTLEPLVNRIFETLESHFCSIQVVLVNDGSRDNSHAVAIGLQNRYPQSVCYIQLARNFGEHNAVMCGLSHIQGDCAVIIDDDFQNPPEEIVKLTDKIAEGYDVVYSCYAEKKHNIFRNVGSRLNDWFATKLLKKPPELYLSSFKAINRFLAETITRYEGPYPYIDGIILRSTNSIASVECSHNERSHGQSNYTLRKLVGLWLCMFTGFSIVPLRAATLLGFVMSVFGFLLTLFFVISRIAGGFFVTQAIPPGWASLIVCTTMFAGIQLMVLGMIGEYLGRLYLTVNKSPQYIVRCLFEGSKETES